MEAALDLTAAIVPAAAEGAEKDQAKAPAAIPPTRAPEVRCAYLITVADDFIVAFTSFRGEGFARGEAKAAKKLQLTWSDDRAVDFVFDYVWSSFSEVENGKHVFHLIK